jgi:NAD dependent epimerase/dehydratase family enzyme
VARAIGWLLDHDHAQGIRLVVGPQALTNKELAIAINRKLEPRRLLLPAPRFALAIVLGEMHQMLLDSCYGHPARLLQDDFQFSFPTIQDALNDLM